MSCLVFRICRHKVLLGAWLVMWGGPGLLAYGWGAPLPAPPKVMLKDDREDRKGTQLEAQWQPPLVVPPPGWRLAGYRVYLSEGAEAPTKAIELIPDAQQTKTIIPELVPWKTYRIGVSAFYLPVGAKIVLDEAVPTGLPVGAQESALSLSEAASPQGSWFKRELANVLVTALVIIAIVIVTIHIARRKDMYIRPIAGLRAVDDAIGRATEMGRPILFVAGLTGVGDIATIAAMLILGHLARRTAAYETPILVPCNDPLVMALQREIVHEAYLEAGKPEAYNPDNIFYVTDSQFGYVAAVDGIMMRQRPAANFYMGFFYAESLILAETGAATGAIQIAGTDADTQLPFFITSCDYTLMGEELYAAGAYLSRDPVLLAQLKGQDIGKLLIGIMLVIGTLLVSLKPETWGAVFMKLIQAE